MKLISIAVPSYNSQEYMRHCIDSLLVGGEDVEIIIVNDGSKDNTLQIANEYAENYPSIVRVIDKENGGHGSGVNAGLQLATGLYYKVVDSDDWVDGQAFTTLINKIKEHLAAGTLPDLYVSNYVYEHASDNTSYTVKYDDKFPKQDIFGWDKVKQFHFSRLMLMHSVLFKRQVLLESGVKLPEHTFYVDNLFAYQPLPYTKTICYLNIDLYRYYIGRADQSVTITNIVKRYDQQIRVMECMLDAYKWDEIKKMPKGLRKYMWQALRAIMMNTVFFTCAQDSPERRKAYKEFWRHMKDNDIKMYRKMRYRSYSTVTNFMPWKLRGWVTTKSYLHLCKKIKLG